MNACVYVRTQEELDAALREGKLAVCLGHERFIVTGSNCVEAGENARVHARGNARTRAWDTASVYGGENTRIEAGENAYIEAWDDAAVDAGGNARVRAWGEALVRARGQAYVQARENASVEIWESARVEARGSARVEAWGSARIEAWEEARVEAGRWAVVYKHGSTPRISGGVVIEAPDLSDAANWSEYWGLTTREGSVVVFKALDDWLRSAWSKRYPVGETVTCPDWNPTPVCGHGLHFSPSPRMARNYGGTDTGHGTRYVACSVKVEEAVVIEGWRTLPDKIKAPRCEVIYECDERGGWIEGRGV